MSSSRCRRGMVAFVACGSLLAALLVLSASPAVSAPGPFRPISPTRLMDTRSGHGGGPFGPGAVQTLVVAGSAGIPLGAVAVVLNVTVTEPTAAGFVTVWPTGAPQPNTSNLNFVANQTVPNMVTVGVGTGGSVSIANAFGSTQVIVDAMGYFVEGFVGLHPARLMDTRLGLGGGRFGGGEVRNLVVAGVAGVPSGVTAVALNVTVTGPLSRSYVTVWPAGTSRPPSSNLNMDAGETVPNMVLVGVGAGGQISIYNDSGLTDVLVDVMGYFSVGGGFTGLVPARLLDTRLATCGVTLGPGETRTLAVTGAGGVPSSGVGAVALNVTATNPSQSSYLTVWPTGQPQPYTSNLNSVAAKTVPNMVTVGVGAGGQISIFNFAGTVDVIVDVMGFFSGDTPTGPLVPCPPKIYTFGDGTHAIGGALPPGRYITAGNTSTTSFCYWERLSGFGGTLNEILSNEIINGQVIVDIKPGDVGFRASRCGTWSTFVDSSYTPMASFSDGVFAVGSQIAPGRYQAVSTTNCYWERKSGFSGSLSEILANNFSSGGTQIVDVLPTDVGFKVSRCGTWTRIA